MQMIQGWPTPYQYVLYKQQNKQQKKFTTETQRSQSKKYEIIQPKTCTLCAFFELCGKN